MSDPDKGKFSAEISQDVIREALESVKRRSGATPDATTGAPAAVPADGAEPVDPARTDPGSQSSGEEAPAAGELETLRAQLEFSQSKGRDLMEKLKDQHERMLRAAADLENYKKRALKEKEEIQKYGAEKLLKDFLPVLDNFDRALEHAEKGGDLESLTRGVQMTRKLFEDTLAKHGVKAFSSLGQPFDPRLQEAMQQVESNEVPPNHVVFELVRGYTLNDRLIRPALVSVAKAPAPPAEADGEDNGTPTPEQP